MDCSKFELSLSEYLDGALCRADAGEVASHALRCRACRAILDEVKAALRDCKYDDDLNAPVELEEALLTIPSSYAPLTCGGFQELITEFLDGFVPAPTYHRFKAHAGACEN